MHMCTVYLYQDYPLCIASIKERWFGHLLDGMTQLGPAYLSPTSSIAGNEANSSERASPICCPTSNVAGNEIDWRERNMSKAKEAEGTSVLRYSF